MRVTEFLVESIVGDLRNSIVRGLKPEYGPGNNAYEGILNGFDQTAKFAKDSFTKDAGGIDNSKVVWALQWYVLDTKMHYLDKRGVVGVEDGTELFTDKEKQRIMNTANKKGVRMGSQQVRNIWPGGGPSDWFMAYDHFAGTHGIANKVQNLAFDPAMTPRDLHNELQKIETDWLETLKDDKRAIQHGGSMTDMDSGEVGDWKELYDVMMEFEDGGCWFNLNRSHCEKEGESMGHCGNKADFDENETIYSYRTPSKDKDGYWIPHLTFIYNNMTGLLGEMKGYGNKKPSEKYHNVIEALITSPWVKEGIRGGGYLPEENFSVWDLDNAEELIKKKPLLAGDNLDKYMYEIGLDKGFEKLIQARIGEDAVFEIQDDVWASKANTGQYLYKVEVRLTEKYKNFAELINAEFHDSPYNMLLKYHHTSDSVPWSTSETAHDVAAEDEHLESERLERILQYSPPAINRIIVEELAHYSGDDPSKVEENIWEYLQNHGGKFSDWIVDATREAIVNGYEEGFHHEIRNQAVHHIESLNNNYFGWGAKESQLTIQAAKPGRWDLDDNECFVTALLMELVEIITDMERDGEYVPRDWWSNYAVESDDEEIFTAENIYANTTWDYIRAIKDFSQSMMHAPDLHDGEAFHEKYDRLRQGVGDPLHDMSAKRLESAENWKPILDEDGNDQMMPLIKKLNKIVKTKKQSKSEHDNMHRLAQLAGLNNPDKTVHKVLKKRGYT